MFYSKMSTYKIKDLKACKIKKGPAVLREQTKPETLTLAKLKQFFVKRQYVHKQE